ncbi:MAG: hypothetical protein HY756_02050 [Nitrospirae bacterium]|nr:hypothetical protein [Nitrospirota bacterium]
MISWNDSKDFIPYLDVYRTGVKEIDNGIADFVMRVNLFVVDMKKTFEEKTPILTSEIEDREICNRVVTTALNSLVRCLEVYFPVQETLMEESNYFKTDFNMYTEHVNQHGDIYIELYNLADSTFDKKILIEKLLNFTKNYLINHVLPFDLTFGSHYSNYLSKKN